MWQFPTPTLKPAGFTAYNVGINNLNERLEDVITNKKYEYLGYKQYDKKKEEEATTEYKTIEEFNIYSDAESIDDNLECPLLEDFNVDNIKRDGDIVYNVLDRENPLLFRFKNPYSDSFIYCYTQKKEGFNYEEHNHDLYFYCNKPFLLMRLEPFNVKQTYILTSNIGMCYN
jgi:hypothetical protein